MKYIVTASEPCERDEIGAKAYNLRRLCELGMNVPDFFCVKASALTGHIERLRGNIDRLIACADPKDAEALGKACEMTASLIRERPLENELLSEIAGEVSKNYADCDSFCVRSSSSCEDSADNSFAGQFDTFLNVPARELFTKIAECWSSLYKPNVLRYCLERGLPVSALGMGVIVGRTVNPELSGIVFTANPLGLLSESVAVVGAGIGSGVVEDKVPVTSYYRDKTDGRCCFESRPGSPVLSSELTRRIFAAADKLTEHFGEYLDIEFAVEADKLYTLQVRPITTLRGGEKVILDNSNIVESYPGITLPLTDSFIREAYKGVFAGIIERVCPAYKHKEKLGDMVSSVNGRVYYRISNWYDALNIIPFRKKIIPIWQDMLGVSDKAYTLTNEYTPVQRAATAVRAIRELFAAPRHMRELNDGFEAIEKYFRETFRPGLGCRELVGIYDRLAELILERWYVTLVNDLYGFIFTGLLKQRLKRRGAENHEELTNSVISGISDIESMRPVAAMLEVCEAALKADAADLLSRIGRKEDPALLPDGELSDAFYRYIELYGDRSPEELKLESETFRSDPSLLARRISEYLSCEGGLERLKRSVGAKKRVDSSLKLGAVNRFLASRATLGIANRERSRLNRSRIYGMIRSIFTAMGENLAADGVIDCARDVFWLKIEEVFSHADGAGTDFRPVVAGRKRRYEIFEKLPAYSRLVFDGEIFDKTHLNIGAAQTEDGDRALVGTPCSAGVAQGEAVVVTDPMSAPNTAGKIIVAKTTDPGWVFLLANAKGIVAEKGSLLSHTAIISRELNIPSIVGVRDATTRIKTGCHVRMNSGTGEIEILSNQKQSKGCAEHYD